jgi:hypothetical protein
MDEAGLFLDSAADGVTSEPNVPTLPRVDEVTNGVTAEPKVSNRTWLEEAGVFLEVFFAKSGNLEVSIKGLDGVLYFALWSTDHMPVNLPRDRGGN